jgi:hypothetical protein
MKVFGRMRVQLHAFLTLAIDWAEWATLRSDRFISGEEAPGTHWTGGWVGPRVGQDAVAKIQISIPCRESNTGPPTSSLVNWMIGWIIKNELERTWKEEGVS